METMEDKIHRLVEYASQAKLHLYTDLLSQKLLEAGVDADLIDNMAQAATLELQVLDVDKSIIAQTLRSEENRGIDTVGRIVIEYCFVRSPLGKMVWPEYSDQDTLARWQFADEVLPRPLMRYFLVSVRGSIDEIDGFTKESMLFENTPDELEAMRETISDLIDNFKGPFGSGESSINWHEVYEDARFQKMALGLVTNLRSKIDKYDLEDYLMQLETYRQMDPNKTSNNIMQRPFTMDDARQIVSALEAAENTLREMTQ